MEGKEGEQREGSGPRGTDKLRKLKEPEGAPENPLCFPDSWSRQSDRLLFLSVKEPLGLDKEMDREPSTPPDRSGQPNKHHQQARLLFRTTRQHQTRIHIQHEQLAVVPGSPWPDVKINVSLIL